MRPRHSDGLQVKRQRFLRPLGRAPYTRLLARSRRQVMGLAFGIFWGALPAFNMAQHGVNMFVDDTEAAWIIEPQNDQLLDPTGGEARVIMM